MSQKIVENVNSEEHKDEAKIDPWIAVTRRDWGKSRLAANRGRVAPRHKKRAKAERDRLLRRTVRKLRSIQAQAHGR